MNEDVSSSPIEMRVWDLNHRAIQISDVSRMDLVPSLGLLTNNFVFKYRVSQAPHFQYPGTTSKILYGLGTFRNQC